MIAVTTSCGYELLLISFSVSVFNCIAVSLLRYLIGARVISKRYGPHPKWNFVLMRRQLPNGYIVRCQAYAAFDGEMLL